MNQREFNRLMAFQPAEHPYESLRELVYAWFENNGEGEEPAKKYLETIRKEFVDEK